MNDERDEALEAAASAYANDALSPHYYGPKNLYQAFKAGASWMGAKLGADVLELVEIVNELKAEIERGKSKDCLGCCNGNDIPEETLCRACWRIWINEQMYLLWDWRTTEARIARWAARKERT